MQKVNIFISYSHVDVGYKDQLQRFMSPLLRHGKLSYWGDEKIMLGSEWDPEIRKAFEESHIILMLISSDFLYSKYIMENEVQWAKKKHQRNEAIIFPIYVRTCYLGENEDITRFQGAPSPDNPISSYEDKDAAYTLVVSRIAERLKDLPNFNKAQYQQQVLQHKVARIVESVDELNKTKKIYLSVGAEMNERKAIFSELSFRQQWENWPYTIIPDPKESQELEQLTGEELRNKIQGYLDESLFSVHLIGDSSTEVSEIVSLQYKLARQRCALSSFRCIVAVNDKGSEETLFMKSGEDYTTNPSIEKVSNWTRDVIVSYIDKHVNESKARIEALMKKARRINERETVFLLYEGIDDENKTREELKSGLEEEGVDVSPNLCFRYSQDDYNIRQYEAEQVRKCDGVVIFYADADDNWCKIRQDFIVKEKVRIRGVCVDDPGASKVGRNVRRTQFVVMNENKQLKIDVRRFVERLRTDNE
jgi:hypothetical protein